MSPQALGIDVSHWQGAVDWNAVRASGILFAFVKATERDNVVDPRLDANWQGMKAAGIIRGGYHFFRPTADAQRQAQHFARHISLASGDMPPVLDLETAENVDNATIIAGVETWLRVVEQLTGRKAIIYTRASFWNTYMKNAGGQFPSWTSNYGVWVASYTTNPQPVIPKGWAKWDFWQYSEQGNVNGVGGNCDVDRFNSSEDDLRTYVGSAPPVVVVAPPPPPPPSPPPPPPDPDPFAGGAVIVRPGDPGFSEGWYFPEGDPEHHISTFNDVYGGQVKYKNGTTADAYYCTYHAQLPGPGRYAIEAFIPDDHNSCQAVGYRILTYQPGGQPDEQLIIVNQSALPNRWAPLGQFDLDPNVADHNAGRVVITDVRVEDDAPLGEVSFGAIRWRRV